MCVHELSRGVNALRLPYHCTRKGGKVHTLPYLDLQEGWQGRNVRKTSYCLTGNGESGWHFLHTPFIVQYNLLGLW